MRNSAISSISETKDGSDMRAYSALLQKAVDSIVATFRRRVAAGLQSERDFVIPERTASRRMTTPISNCGLAHDQGMSSADFDCPILQMNSNG